MFATALLLSALSVISSPATLPVEPGADSLVAPPERGAESPKAILSVGGDKPPATVFTWNGHGGVAMDVQAFPGQSGTFSISGIPEGAAIVWACMYEASWESLPTNAASAVFAGDSLPWIVPFDHDPGWGYDSTSYLDLCAYRWEVTDLVTGNGDYAFSVSPLALSYGEALVVIYTHPSKPLVQVIVNEGCESLYRAKSSSTFDGVVGDSATLYLFTQADDVSGETESISLNGEIILGPGNVFQGNKGYAASFFELPVLCAEGLNGVSCSTDIDWFGWHLAVLEGRGYNLVELVDAPAGRRFALRQNSPNPFRARTAISYSVPALSHVRLDVFDSAGRLVESLVNGTCEPGTHHAYWAPEAPAAGIYFCRYDAGGFKDAMKMILVR